MKEIPQLTGLRGALALDVVLGHYDFGYVPLARHLIFHNAAVDVFFCLSSFTLGLVYGAGTERRLDLRAFAVARIARIYPVYLATLLLSVLVLVAFDRAAFGPAVIRETTLRFVWQLFLLAAFPVKRLIGFWDIPAWSVSVEAFCYALVFPPVFRLSRRVAASPAALLAAAIVAGSAIDYLGFTRAFQANILGIGYGSATREVAYWAPLGRGVAMFVAGWLCCLLVRFRPAVAGLAGRLADPVACAFVLVVVLASHGIGERQFVVFLAPWLILGLMNARARVSRLLASVPFVFLGRISYSLYLVHVPVLIAYHAHPLFRTHDALDFYAPFLISFALAILSYRAVETPARRFIRRRFGGTREAAATDRPLPTGGPVVPAAATGSHAPSVRRGPDTR